MQINPSDLLTSEIKGLVAAYLAARVHAEMLREKIDAIYLEIICGPLPIWDFRTGERILNPKNMWRASDEKFGIVAAEANKRERAEGLKPTDMPDEYCPALVAENALRDAENALIEASGKPFGVTNHKLLCTAGGLVRRQKWLDLIVGMVLAAERQGIKAA